jgi:hypothetical protein
LQVGNGCAILSFFWELIGGFGRILSRTRFTEETVACRIDADFKGERCMVLAGQSSTQVRIRYSRAIVMFVLAYIVVTILGIALSISIGVLGHIPESVEPMKNEAYLISERFLPLLNLVVWGMFAWGYFRGRMCGRRSTSLRREAWALGVFWLVVAVVVDFVGFVLIKNPISLSPHDFYIGQFPWIYLIYIAVLFSPVGYVILARGGGERS